MPRTPARFTQADVARALRAARQAGGAGVEVKPDGTIVVKLATEPAESALSTLAPDDDIVL